MARIVVAMSGGVDSSVAAALLVIDSTQGIETQTLANLYLALEADLAIIPVINKIDLPSAEPERVKQEVEEVIGLPKEECILASAKECIGTQDIWKPLSNMCHLHEGTQSCLCRHWSLIRIMMRTRA